MVHTVLRCQVPHLALQHLLHLLHLLHPMHP
jgi:hypothetical protein